MTPTVIVICGLAAGLATLLGLRRLRARREAYLRAYTFPASLFEKLRERHPALTPEQYLLVEQGLRQFFLAHHKSGREFVSMPSQIADDLWHEFILYTRLYQQFCRRGFGRFLHHTPAAMLSKGQRSNAGMRRCWVHVCRQELIDPRQPSRLPLLFALDAQLNVPNGFTYVPDCSGLALRTDGGAMVYCCTDLGGSAGGCGGDSGGAHGHSGSDSGCSGDGGGGDGGDGGGGGCGGDGGGGCGGGGGGD